MKINKLFGVKSITNLIYGILLFIPFASILSRVIYVQANPFAKDSYSNTQVTKIEKINNLNQFAVGKTYNIEYKTGGSLNYVNWIKYSYIDIDWTNYGFSDLPYDEFALFENGLVKVNYNGVTYNSDYNVWGNSLTEFNFTFVSYNNSVNPLLGCANFYLYYFTTDKLDNVFLYSIDSFIADNNLGNVDFFSWFTNMFLNQDNPTNAVYLGFTNWYLNYALLVSSGYLLFFALMWFINYVRKMLEKASYHDFGGF